MDCQNQINNQLYDRHNPVYVQDRIRASLPTNQYFGQITLNTVEYPSGKPPESHRVIDGAVEVVTVDDKVRQSALNYFDTCSQEASAEQVKRRSQKKTGIWITVVGAVAIIGGGIALGVSLATLPVSLPVIGLGIIVLVVGARRTATNQDKIKGLNNDLSALHSMREEWRDPIQHAIDERRRCGVEGFKYVFSHNLKNTIVHPHEVSELWKREFASMLSSPQGIAAFSTDHMGKAHLEYAWNGGMIPDLEIGHRKMSSSLLNLMAARYQECSNAFHFFSAKNRIEIRDLENQAQKIKSEIAEQRSLWMEPAHHIYKLGMQEACCLYDRAIAPFIQERDFAIAEIEREYRYTVSDPHWQDEITYQSQLNSLRREAIARVNRDYACHPAIVSIEQAYRRDCALCAFLFDQTKHQVDSFFDKRVRQLEAEVSASRQSIQECRVKGEQYFADYLNRVLQEDDEQRLNSSHVVPPNTERQWKLSLLDAEPSWNDVYGSAPRFQTSFSENLDEASWNLFWGIRGLGRFAATPLRSWRQISFDWSHFPFQQRGFNLHRLAQVPRRGMFAQRVSVPAPPARRPAPVHVVPGQGHVPSARVVPEPRKEAPVHVAPGQRTEQPARVVPGQGHVHPVRVVPGHR